MELSAALGSVLACRFGPAVGVLLDLVLDLPDPYRHLVAEEDVGAFRAGTIEDLLGAVGLIGSNGCLNKAGEILLCEPAGADSRELIVYQYRESVGGEVKAGRRFSGPLLTVFSEAMTAIEARIDTSPLNLSSGQQLQIQNYPIEAVREAVANAVMHGDLRERRPVQIEHSPESLEVRSPGPLVAGVSPENILTHPPKPRFPTLAEAMRSLGLAEKWGQGLDRMYREAMRNGKDAPTVTVSEGQSQDTTVRFMGGAPNTRVAKFIASLADRDQEDTDALITVSVLTHRRGVTAETLMPIVQRDMIATQAVLSRLSTGPIPFIEPTARTSRNAYPEYRLTGAAIAALGSALGYNTRMRTDSDRKIIEHIREYETINNGAVQRLLDVDVFGARDTLRDLVDCGVIKMSAGATRGRGVKYEPGSEFPSRRKSKQAE